MVVNRSQGVNRYVHRGLHCETMLNGIGDMQMTKAEIAATQIIVTTPEKWDVVTRKPTGEGELASVGDDLYFLWNY